MELAAEMAQSMVHKVDLLILTRHEQPLGKHFPREVAVLQQVIESLRAKLVDSRVFATTDAASRDKATKVIAALYDIEHFVDRIYAATAHQRGSSSLLGLPVHRIVDSFLNYRCSASKIRVMRMALENQVADYTPRLLANTSDLELRRDNEKTDSLLSAASLVGRKSERNAINRLLVGDLFSAVLIHGKEGLGKTTVAQLVCLPSPVFDHCFWVWVGNELNPSSVISKVRETVGAQIRKLPLKTTPTSKLPSRPPATTFTKQIQAGQSGTTLAEQITTGQFGATLTEQIPAGQLDTTLTQHIREGELGTTFTEQIPARQPDTTLTQQTPVGQSATILTQNIPVGQSVTEQIPAGQSDIIPTKQIPERQYSITLTQKIPPGQSGTTQNKHIQVGQSNTTGEDVIRPKKFLLVLDDVRSLDEDTLVTIRDSLFAGSSTIKVVITTRSKQLATAIYGEIPTTDYELRALSDEDAFTLFKKVAVSNHHDTELEDLCWEMVKRSNNVPRMIIDLAFLVKGHKQRKWKTLMNADFSRLRELGEAYSPFNSAIDVAFHLLPSPLKRCFAYSAFLFQQNDKIKMQKQIHLWIAQGYIKEPALDDENRTLEEVSEDYYRVLEDWSFLINHKSDFDLAKYIAAHEMLAINFDCAGNGSVLDIVPYDCNGIYHLFISNISSLANASSCPSRSNSSSVLEDWITKLPPNLRSFVKAQGSTLILTESICIQLFSSLGHLRALDLNSSNIIVVPASIALLKHLRYLNLSLNDFTKLPDSITTLPKLQVIDLSFCKELVKLPRHFSRLSSLRHLYLNGCEKLTGMPVGLRKMTALQTLNLFVLGNTQKSCTLDELSSLNLKSELIYRFASQYASSSQSSASFSS